MIIKELKTYFKHQTFKFVLLLVGITASLFVLFFLFQSNYTVNVNKASYTRIEIILNNIDNTNFINQKEFINNIISNEYNTNTRYIKVATLISEENLLFCGTWATEGILTHSVNEGRGISDFEIKSKQNIAIVNHSYLHNLLKEDINFGEMRIDVNNKKYIVLGKGSVYYPVHSYENTSFVSAIFKAFPFLNNYINNTKDYSWRSYNIEIVMVPLLSYLENNHNISFIEILVPSNQTYNESLLISEFNHLFPFSIIKTKKEMMDFNKKAVRVQMLNYIIISIICLVNILSLFMFWLYSRKKSIAIFKLCGYSNIKIYNILLQQLIIIYSIGFGLALFLYKFILPIWYKLIVTQNEIYSSPKIIDAITIYFAVLFFIWLICHRDIKRTSNLSVISIIKGT
ncbi:MAG: hypothetical protein KAG94_06850 [Clostridiales bacterium]|nr:hypothetical protein [Clostridiales bacterium]